MYTCSNFEFYWSNFDEQEFSELNEKEKYKKIISWAIKARGVNPGVFDDVTEWILDDSRWTKEKLDENKNILYGVFDRFKEQNKKLRRSLAVLEPSGVVNVAVFKALDRFDDILSGRLIHAVLKAAVESMFSNFSVMMNRSIREQIAGNRTGPTGTDSVDLFGYINFLKDSDAGVQWALFMPDVVERQQKGFKVVNFEYKEMPEMRFIGQEEIKNDVNDRRKIFATLDDMSGYNSEFTPDVLFMHHYGLGVDIGPWHGVWGRFMKADTPVPEGFLHFDFVPYNDGKAGVPYISQFAYATFAGDVDAMHECKGYDANAMYDVTRNIMLGQGVNIPYPDKYWTAEVFPDGYEKPGTIYMFSALL